MNYLLELMEAMLKHGYRLEFVNDTKGTWVIILGPNFNSSKPVPDFATGVGLAAYWLSETNGIPTEAKAAVDAILYRKIKKGHRTEKASHEHPKYQNTVTLAFAYEMETKLDTALDLLKQVMKDHESNIGGLADKIETFLKSEP